MPEGPLGGGIDPKRLINLHSQVFQKKRAFLGRRKTWSVCQSGVIVIIDNATYNSRHEVRLVYGRGTWEGLSGSLITTVQDAMSIYSTA